MSPSRLNKLFLGTLIVVLLVGVVDAVVGGEWDFFALFIIAGTLAAALYLRLDSRRPPVPIRRDLVTWLERRADVSGEPLTVVADRALADYQNRYGHGPVERETA